VLLEPIDVVYFYVYYENSMRSDRPDHRTAARALLEQLAAAAPSESGKPTRAVHLEPADTGLAEGYRSAVIDLLVLQL
jgi:hypothetical protein